MLRPGPRRRGIGERQNRDVNPRDPPQSADPFDNPRVTAPVNFSALVSLYSAPTRSSRGSACPGEMAVEPSRNANRDRGPIEYAGPTLQPKESRKFVPGGSPTNVYERVTNPNRPSMRRLLRSTPIVSSNSPVPRPRSLSPVGNNDRGSSSASAGVTAVMISTRPINARRVRMPSPPFAE